MLKQLNGYNLIKIGIGWLEKIKTKETTVLHKHKIFDCASFILISCVLTLKAKVGRNKVKGARLKAINKIMNYEF